MGTDLTRGTEPGRRPRGAKAPLWLAAALLILASCSGGSTDETAGPLPCTNISFTRALTTSPAAGDVYLSPVTTSCTTADIAVNIANLSGIYTVGFDLTYPKAAVGYTSYTLGPLLQQGSPVNSPQVIINDDPSAGLLQVAMSRLAPDPAVNASGSVVLITFRFSKVASGSGAIDFDGSAGSLVTEQIQDANGLVLAATFGPGHGGTILVP